MHVESKHLSHSCRYEVLLMIVRYNMVYIMVYNMDSMIMIGVVF